tara:strand:+ start:469 stop:1194 length:726 start_codon:yes stop_codon:yes gene_type:complete
MRYCRYCCQWKPDNCFVIKTCEQCRPRKNAANKKYCHSDLGTKTRADFWKSDPGKDVRRTYLDTDKAKVTIKQNRATPTAAAAIGRSRANTKEKYRTNPSRKLNLQLVSAVKGILSGRNKTSFKLQLTAFDGPSSLLEHFEQRLKAGMTMENYGTAWTVAHRVPRVYFDHDIPGDVKKCWSPDNMYPEYRAKNQSDSHRIKKGACIKLGMGNLPISWDGSIPCKDEIRVLEADAHAGRGLG